MKVHEEYIRDAGYAAGHEARAGGAVSRKEHWHLWLVLKKTPDRTERPGSGGGIRSADRHDGIRAPEEPDR